MKKAMLATVAFIFLVPLGLLAQSATPAEGYYAGSFARLSYLVGDVFVQRTADQATEKAEVNLVLVQGDKLGTGIGQAEIQFGGRNYLRLDNNSKVEFVALPTEGDNLIKIHILEGSAYLRVGSLSGEKAVEVHTPDASFYVLEEGLYRFNVDPNTQTEVFVHEGSLEAAGEEGSVVIKGGESLAASDGRLLGEPGYFQSRDDAFDQWNQSRDALFAQRSTTSYLPSQIDEYQEELDQNGRWSYEQPYGYVWSPYGVGADWRPYMQGHWTWYPLCGWTWVSAEPWGWSVYHYGRWQWRFGLGWYWIPQNYWGPAWVHWWWDRDYIGWCPMSWYNRPGVLYGDRYYDRYHDQYFSGHNRAMSVIHRNQLQAHELSRHVLRSNELDHLDRISLRAEQPGFRPGIGRSSLQSPEGQRIFSARPGVRSEAKNYPSGSSASSSRLRSRDGGAPGRGSSVLSSADRRGAAPDRALKNGSEPSRGASSGREVRAYPSQSSIAPARGSSSAPARQGGNSASRSPRSSGNGASRVYPSRPDNSTTPRAQAPKSDNSRPAAQPRREESSSGAKTKSADPVKHYPSASREASSAWAPRSSSTSRIARPDAFASARTYPSRESQRGRATPEYSSRLGSGGQAADRVSRPARTPGNTADSGRTPSYSRTDRAAATPSRSSVSEAPRYNPRSYSYSRPSSPSPSHSSSGSAAPRYSSPSRSSGSPGRSSSLSRPSVPSASRNSYSAAPRYSSPSRSSGSPDRSSSLSRPSVPSASRNSYSAPSRGGSSGRSSVAPSASATRSSSSSTHSSSSTPARSSSGHSGARKKG